MKRLIAISAAAALMSTASVAQDDLKLQIELLKEQMKKLEEKIVKNEQSVEKVSDTVNRNKKSISDVKILANNDNLKFDVDFRTSMDSLSYKHANGTKSKNSGLLSSRLWLGMGYAPDENNLFKGKLSYNKAFGDSVNHSQSNVSSGATSLNTFDWVVNEALGDNSLKVKEAYWLYMNDTFLDTEVPWTISIGRRPSTDGLGINMREGMGANSPLSHTVNVEFDGMSAKFNLDKVTGIDGMWWKLCTGRGLSSANELFDMTSAQYAKSNGTTNTDMYGFIFVPYDDGQYSVWTNWARADHMIGFDLGMVSGTPDFMSYSTMPTYTDNNMDGIPDAGISYTAMPSAYKFKDFGSLDLATVMFKAEGIGDGISDFLDDTRVFVSLAQSKTRPKAGMAMLGSPKSETGHSEWIGVNMPCLLTEDGRIGIEWNKGSKYWRSVTYGEDTMAGSKIAARGDAWEIYYTKPLTKALTLNARYTAIDYDYTGSNSFFGEDGTPMTMAQGSAAAAAMGMVDPIKEARDFRIAVSYRY